MNKLLMIISNIKLEKPIGKFFWHTFHDKSIIVKLNASLEMG